MAFPMFSSGLESLVKTGLWPDGSPLWIAFSKSLCINVIGCFGWTMMLSHEWINMSIAAGKFAGLVEFGDSIDKSLWFGTVPRTILLFWLPAHTITFSLPGVWRILMAASLSVVLGFLLTAGKQNIGSVNSAVSIESVSFTGSNDSDYK
ncbi:MAG: hypothetical protein CVV64_11565 [Candidatus Wallbacteria bacterium HGW-Wallbacteria-1]|uniref:Uncharacterized protein n=1 Tax=Candidatus Wallbacteria bacterium HGW-Wallbacteria-1 TaxID=2013854 RepID=A0A2N1PNP3_9BACT|nr:MAG: hypothetical protein CVV64_11565 [Candidatus Wallbacteria bacterium HGW-Wallbacteria-1]